MLLHLLAHETNMMISVLPFLVSLCSGQLAQWDTFLTQVEGFTTLVPMITSPGNHEVRLLRTVLLSERKLAAANRCDLIMSFLDSCLMAIRDSN